jgi:hypothetical protein
MDISETITALMMDAVSTSETQSTSRRPHDSIYQQAVIFIKMKNPLKL